MGHFWVVIYIWLHERWIGFAGMERISILFGEIIEYIFPHPQDLNLSIPFYITDTLQEAFVILVLKHPCLIVKCNLREISKRRAKISLNVRISPMTGTLKMRLISSIYSTQSNGSDFLIRKDKEIYDFGQIQVKAVSFPLIFCR